MKNKVLSFAKSFRFIVKLTYDVDKKIFFLNTLFFILSAVVPLFSLWVLKLLVDRIVVLKNVFDSSIYFLVLLFILFQLLQAFIQQWSVYNLQKQQYLLNEYISLRVLRKASEIEYAFFEDPDFYDSLHLTQQQSAYLPSQIIVSLQSFLQQILTVVALAGFLVSVHWSIPIFLILFSLPLAISKMYFGQKQFLLEKAIVPEQRKAYDLFHYVTNLIYAKELRLFNFGTLFTSKYREQQQFIFEKRNKLQYIFMQKSMVITLFEVLFITLFYIILVGRSIAGLLSIGSLIIYFQAFQRLQLSVNGLFKSASGLFQHQLYLLEIMKYLSMSPRDQGRKMLHTDSFNISVSNLSFNYPKASKDVLSNVSLNFVPGQFVAIVGENGSGKSTLLKLLCGLYQTERGEIKFGEVNSNNLPSSFFSEHVSVVFQDFGKYHMTVEDNIALGQLNPDKKKVFESLQLATGSSMLDSLEAGLQTSLGRTYKLGEELSGGQWQKIALARALYKEAEVLILDEPTSAIDPISEMNFFQTIKSNIDNKIVILITHRLHNLRLADQIYVLHESKLVESGKFDQLIDQRGYFFRYFQAQQV
jgi:ATP-binding cassette subfamily B protein